MQRSATGSFSIRRARSLTSRGCKAVSRAHCRDGSRQEGDDEGGQEGLAHACLEDGERGAVHSSSVEEDLKPTFRSKLVQNQEFSDFQLVHNS